MMNRMTSLTTLVFAASLAVCPQYAAATGVGGMARALKSTPAVRYISGRAPTLAPFAHVVFCMKLPSECEKGVGPEIAEVDAGRMSLLQSVNDVVNRTIHPRNDAPNAPGGFGDDWELKPSSGDCEDFAITKRHELIAKGWPVRSLRLAVATTPWGEGHAVLIVKTNEGDLVLDNRTGAIKPFQKTDLRFEKIQSEDNPRMWLGT